MASSFASSFSNTDPSLSALGITREEFNAFHKIDRTLFTCLVFGLNRDMNQSSQVIGLLYLLEQIGYARNLIAFLISLPDAFIDAVANEIVVCLSLLYNQDYSAFLVANNNDDHSIIPLVMRMTGGRLTLKLIYQNRETFIFGLTKNLNDICNRAFEDIFVRAERYNKEKLLALEREKVIEEMKKIRLGGQQETINRLSVQQERVFTTPPAPPPAKEEARKTAAETEEAEKEKNQEVVVPADDRTIFLTFSKGYPITEEQVRVYFEKKFGEVIEGIEMQEVEENEQPLYAKMVVKMQCVSKIEEIVSARGRTKFTIDGKHVWARKYVRKNPNSSPSPSPSSSYI